MAVGIPQLNLSGLRGAYGYLGDVRRQNALLRDQRRQNRGRMLGALAGLGVGAATGGAGGALIGLNLGAQAGTGMAGGQVDPVAAGSGIIQGINLNQQMAAQDAQQQAGTQVQSALRGMRTPVVPEVGAAGTTADLSPQQRERNALLSGLGGVARINPGGAAQAAMGLRTPEEQPPESFTLGPGQTRFVGSTPVATVPAEQERPNPPSGYRWNAENNLEFIPGGPADPAAQPAEDEFFAGTGLSSADARVLNNVAPKIADDTATAAQRRAYAQAYGRATREEFITLADGAQIQRPRINLPEDQFPVPSGVVPPQTPAEGRSDPQAGRSSGATSGGRVVSTKPVPTGDAGKLANIQVAQEEIATVRSEVLTPQGADRALIGQMTLNLPGTRGRDLRQAMERSLEAKIRLDSGAAVPETEVQRLAERYMPSVFDSEEGIRAKFDAIQQYMESVTDLSTIGRGVLSESTLSKLENRKQSESESLRQLRKEFNLERVP